MSKIIRFIPKHEFSAQQNLNEFIILARDQLTLWSDLEGFSWDANRWCTPFRTVRFINFEHASLHSRKKPELHQLMHPFFAEFAKAYLRYKNTLCPRKTLSNQMQALRVIEFALSQDFEIPDITKFEQRHWDRAITALETFAARENICTLIKSILKMLADLFIVNVDPTFWNHPYQGLHSYNVINGSRAPDEIKAKKIPNQDALLTIAEVFSRGESETYSAEDVLVTSITGLLLSAPMRISETLRFRTDCLHNGTDKNGEMQHYLAYWVPKTRQFARKPIPSIMVDVTTEAIKRLSVITEEGRRLASYMETNPAKFYRHSNCPDVPDDQELTPDQAVEALGFASQNSCRDFIRRHTGNGTLLGFTLDALWQLVLIEHRAFNPHFPYQEAPDSSAQLPLKMSESLMCFRRSELTTRVSTSPVLLKPFHEGYYSGRLNIGSRNREHMNFFARNGYPPLKLNSHSLRHLLNRLGRASGLSVEMLTEWSSRASTRQTRTYLNDDPIKTAAKGAMVLGTIQEQEPLNPVTNGETELYGNGPFHRSRYGICRRSWRAGPCNKFADCLNCSELLMCKGDKIAAEIIKLDRDNLVRTYTAAQRAIAEGERAASRWTEKAGPQIERLDQLLVILHNPEIPDGSPIEIAGEDFSHEKVILSEKAKTTGVKLLDRNELRITYGDDLLACLELLRSSDNA
ncbi:integrase [Pseudomonas sp. PDM31]|uniref:integrase n=1 Tax=Pseudomonas sp. PDM31 TaxID=2854778 RepID=UPI001C44F372|nr:integrase [Pseudomonas sp. PDM31]MBV7477655.1 integrase [Pseudomonas sp. PDM31]